MASRVIWKRWVWLSFQVGLGQHITWKQPASDALTSTRIPSIHNANIFYPIVELNLRQGKITRRVQRNKLLCQAQQFNPCLQRKVHFSVERTGRSRKNCYSFSFFPNDLFDNFLQFNFWTNWSLQGNTACSRQFWWKRLRTNYTTQCQHKDVSKDFRTRNYRLPSTKPPEMENYPGVANPDWSSAQGKTVTRCIIWRLLVGKGLRQPEVSKGRGFPRTQHTLQEGPWRGHPNPPNYYLGSFINVLVTSYPRSRMNAQAGSPTDELLIFLCHLRTSWPKARTESRKLNDMTTVLNSKWNILHTASSSLTWYASRVKLRIRDARALHTALATWTAVTCDISQASGHWYWILSQRMGPLLKAHSRPFSVDESCMLHSCVQFQGNFTCVSRVA